MFMKSIYLLLHFDMAQKCIPFAEYWNYLWRNVPPDLSFQSLSIFQHWTWTPFYIQTLASLWIEKYTTMWERMRPPPPPPPPPQCIWFSWQPFKHNVPIPNAFKKFWNANWIIVLKCTWKNKIQNKLCSNVLEITQWKKMFSNVLEKAKYKRHCTQMYLKKQSAE